MQVSLMNRNIAVLDAIMVENTFTKIIAIKNIEYAPISIYNAYYDKSKSLIKAINEWFKGRSIPSWRKDLKKLLRNLNVNYTEELLMKSYGLSLSDCYFIREMNNNVLWENINFFDNDFLYLGYLEATYSDSVSNKLSLVSPNNTTDGMLSKAWILKDNKRKLLKGTYTSSRVEPINEYIASIICEKLNINHVDYKIDIYNNKIVSVCDNCLNSHEEIISAYDIFMSKSKSNNDSEYNHYVKILESFSLTDIKKNLSDMYLVDYIMMNYDRHMKNYGVIRDVESLKITRFMPIFDNGQSLCCDKLLDDMSFTDGECKLFTSAHAKFSDLLNYIDLSLYDINLLKDIPDILSKTLYTYNKYTEINEERIKKIVNGIRYRIDYLIKLKNKI